MNNIPANPPELNVSRFVSYNLIVTFIGGRTADSIVLWAMEKWEKQQPPPEVYQVTSQDIMNQCTQRQLCFISFLPHILDSNAAGRNAYLEIAKAIGKGPCFYSFNVNVI